MKLRHQLLLISLVTLLIPWAGSLFIKELEQTLRHNQLNNLSQQARLIAQQLAENADIPSFNNEGYPPIYGFKLPSPIILDGYFDDWKPTLQSPVSTTISSGGHANTIQTHYLAGVHRNRFYLFINVKTPSVSYRNPGKNTLTQSDHLRLKLRNEDGNIVDVIASPIAPGRLELLTQTNRSPSYFGHNSFRQSSFRKDARLRGYWQDTPEGYQVELELPLAYAKHGLGFTALKSTSFSTQSQSQQRSQEIVWSGVIPPYEDKQLPAVIYRLYSLETMLKPFVREFTRISLVNQDNWVIAQAGHTDQEEYSANWQRGEYDSLARDLLLALFRVALGESKPSAIRKSAPGQRDNLAIDTASTQRPSTDWFYESQSNQAIIAAAYPLARDTGQKQATVLVEQTTDAIASLSDKAMVRLIAISFSVVLLIVFVLLGFAFFLSWRVAGLRNKIDHSINDDGRLSAPFEASRANDELGDLSRSFSAMHQEVVSYTDYLETFSRKLSHELKTPLAIVRSSIENLAMEEHTVDASTFLQRADEGTQRLSQILSSMSEATRLEKSICNTERETFNLTDVVNSVGEAFQGLFNDHKVSLLIEPATRLMLGSPDLIAQLIDKLMDNAKDFTPHQGKISIILKSRRNDYLLQITNEGPPLPDTMQKDIFNAFVSLRNTSKDDGHLGQGLVIVRLIAEYHKGQVTARNLENNQGVCFEVSLPSL